MCGKWCVGLFLDILLQFFQNAYFKKRKEESGSVQRSRNLQGLLGLGPVRSLHFPPLPLYWLILTIKSPTLHMHRTGTIPKGVEGLLYMKLIYRVSYALLEWVIEAKTLLNFPDLIKELSNVFSCSWMVSDLINF